MTDTAEMPKLDPRRTALLVMDYQPGIVERVPEPEALIERAQAALAAARAAGMTVGYVRVAFTDEDMEAMPAGAPMARVRQMPREFMHADEPTTQIDPRVAPADGDIVVRKTRVGAFGTTDLDQQLRARGVDTLLLAGISTSGVMISTLLDAHDRDYRLFVLADATADPDPETHAFLTESFFPKRATVIEVADLEGLLG
ncbi:MAG: cysteine hydrolase [Solirubrobacterales bacterium]